MSEKKEKQLTAVTILMMGVFLLVSVLPVHSEKEIYEKSLRLHVIANSDSRIDQDVKLRVRDGILEYLAPTLAEANSREDAARSIAVAKAEIESIGQQILAEAGFDYGAELEVCFEDYPRKEYEGFCFPAGNYLSVKVKLGNADGENWWCVLFPKLCTSTAMSPEEEFVAVGFTPDQYKIITETENTAYKIRFRFLEFFEEIRNGA